MGPPVAPPPGWAPITRPMLTALALATLLLQPTESPPVRSEDVETCLSCHGDPQLSLTLPSGEELRLYVDREAFGRSVHGNKLGCTDCHVNITEVPHPVRPFASRRELTTANYEQCKRCHFANYTKTLDSVHYAALARGDRTAPVCVDCHGSHEINRPGQPRARISQTCAKCHQGVSATYARSVHGRALVADDNPDVPVCTDCHRSHDIAGPHAQNWLLRTPELCGSCHTDERLMARYGLSTNVLQTYLADFHGMTASLRRNERQDESASLTALCTDCHGVHDITTTNDPRSHVLQANLVKTCQRCHPGATENFPAAWLSHYEPSWEKAPLVYGVKVFYAVFIPFVVGGLLLQILLHLWRMVVNR